MTEAAPVLQPQVYRAVLGKRKCAGLIGNWIFSVRLTYSDEKMLIGFKWSQLNRFISRNPRPIATGFIAIGPNWAYCYRTSSNWFQLEPVAVGSTWVGTIASNKGSKTIFYHLKCGYNVKFLSVQTSSACSTRDTCFATCVCDTGKVDGCKHLHLCKTSGTLRHRSRHTH